MATKNLGSLPRDDNKIAIQAGGTFVTQDATGTPQESPLTVSSTNITISIPAKAVEMVIRTDVTLRVSDQTDPVGGDQHYVQGASTTEIYQVARMDNLYLVREGGSDATVQFRFNLV